jgi:putative glutamine amidotransferase
LSRLPLVGLPTQSIRDPGKPPRFSMNQSYVRALTAAGCTPVLIPLLDDDDQLRTIYQRLDGIVFPGGADVAPKEYGEEPIDGLIDVQPERDRTELRLARWAFEDDLPTLGICRGQQLINVALGGTLYQDLIAQGKTKVQHDGSDGRARDRLVHRVRIDPDSKLAQLIDETSVETNSLHHQAVKEVAPALRVTGTAHDDVIEAVESPDRRFWIAVQWHPEEIDDEPWVQRLFRGFAKAAADGQ